MKTIFRSGYLYTKLWSHPCCGKQGYVAVHRIVMEKHIGRYLASQEVIHHIDGDITNNNISNLQLFSSHGEHTKIAHPDLFEKQKNIFKGKHFSPKSEFKKGSTPWNKGKKGVMPTPWNKDGTSGVKGKKWKIVNGKRFYYFPS